MLLRDLLEDPELGLVALTGEDCLDRPIRWVYTTDLRDPRRYLSGGELVLTGMMWRRGPEDSEVFVAALAESGVAALVSGTAQLGAAPPDLVRACASHGVPLLEVPIHVSFNAISDRVILGIAAERGSGEPAGGSRRLVTAVAEGGEGADVLRIAAAELGHACLVLSIAGRIVAHTPAARLPEAPERRALVAGFLEAARFPRTVAAERHEWAILPAGKDPGQRLAGWFLAVPTRHDALDGEELGVLAELGTAVALLRTRHDEGRRVARGAAGGVLRMALDGTASPAEVSARLATIGTGEPTRAVVARLGEDLGLVMALLEELCAELAPGALVGSAGDEGVALLPGEVSGDFVDRLRAAVAVLEPGLEAASLTVGVSGPVGGSGLRGAVEEARHARRLAAWRLADRAPEHETPGGRDRTERRSGERGAAAWVGGHVGVAAGDELASHSVLLAAVPDELRHSFRERLLRPLHDYDTTHSSDLVRTLRVFLDHGGSWSRAAARLHVHVNTLRYRVRRIEEISGKDLASFRDRVDLYLALQLQ